MESQEDNKYSNITEPPPSRNIIYISKLMEENMTHHSVKIKHHY